MVLTTTNFACMRLIEMEIDCRVMYFEQEIFRANSMDDTNYDIWVVWDDGFIQIVCR